MGNLQCTPSLGNLQCALCVTREEPNEVDGLVKDIGSMESEIEHLRREIAREHAAFERVHQETVVAARRRKALRTRDLIGKRSSAPVNAATAEQQFGGASPRCRKQRHRRDRSHDAELPRVLDATDLTSERFAPPQVPLFGMHDSEPRRESPATSESSPKSRCASTDRRSSRAVTDSGQSDNDFSDAPFSRQFSDSASLTFRATARQMHKSGSLSDASGIKVNRRHSWDPAIFTRFRLHSGDSTASSTDDFSKEDSKGPKLPLPIVRRSRTHRRSSAQAASFHERGIFTSGLSLRKLLSRPDASPVVGRPSVLTPQGESKGSLFCVDIDKPEADGCFLGGHIDLVGQLEQSRFRNVQESDCLDVTKAYGVHVVCIARVPGDDCQQPMQTADTSSSSGPTDDEEEGQSKSTERWQETPLRRCVPDEAGRSPVRRWTTGDTTQLKLADAPGMNWTPGDTTQLKLGDRLYVGGSRDGASRFAAAVGTLHEMHEEMEWAAIPVPQHWVGWRLGRQTDEHPKGLNLRVTCGATLLGLRNVDGTVELFPDSNTELETGQEMLFLHGLKSHPGAALEFVLDPQLLDPERWRRLSSAVNSVLRGAVCGVCFDTLQVQGAECRKFACGHMFHGACVEGYVNEYNSCPLCREKVWEWGRNAETKKWEVRDRRPTCRRNTCIF